MILDDDLTGPEWAKLEAELDEIEKDFNSEETQQRFRELEVELDSMNLEDLTRGP